MSLYCHVEVCPTCGRKTDEYDRRLRRCLDGCGHSLEPMDACGENGHADGSSDVYHSKKCKGKCGYPKEGRPPKKAKKLRSKQVKE